ncbi:hypothetical protein [Pasteurella dagmatis]|uniref:Uncharacterized protein n=1 Tax=Pasteurella dagmatis ATCC 43325 TaxID=667128 RepID=C9PNL0_9PAST|nr:hypothetical protein [Pasteurella dagmatis]EEX50997.1 hypothetical protein HMPREF0621_0584 [Pasteurella dagmatis ATCC 43325]
MPSEFGFQTAFPICKQPHLSENLQNEESILSTSISDGLLGWLV